MWSDQTLAKGSRCILSPFCQCVLCWWCGGDVATVFYSLEQIYNKTLVSIKHERKKKILTIGGIVVGDSCRRRDASGPNNARHTVWALGEFFFFFPSFYLILTKVLLYICSKL